MARSEVGRDEPGNHGIGRSRGGLSTKSHALVDGLGRLLVLIVGPGQAGDCPVLRCFWASCTFRAAAQDVSAPPRVQCARTRPDLIDRAFQPEAPDRLWVADIT